LRYLTAGPISGSGGTKTTSGAYTIHTFTSGGNFTITLTAIEFAGSAAITVTALAGLFAPAPAGASAAIIFGASAALTAVVTLAARPSLAFLTVAALRGATTLTSTVAIAFVSSATLGQVEVPTVFQPWFAAQGANRTSGLFIHSE
jgi:hypothetical protein